MNNPRSLTKFVMFGLICGCSSQTELVSRGQNQSLTASPDAAAADASACSDESDGAVPVDAGLNAAHGFRLSELAIDPPGADGNNEFIELDGPPCSVFAGHYLVCIEGDSESNPGSVDRVIGFDAACNNGPCGLGPEGRLVVTAQNGWQKPEGSEATWLTVSGLTGGGLENGTTTLMLLECATAPVAGRDWDPTNSGTLQLPEDCQVVDSVAWLDRADGDYPYSDTRLGPKPAVGGAVRCAASDAGSKWYFGVLGNVDAAIAFTGNTSPNAPIAPALSPGLPNHCAAELSDNSDAGLIVSELTDEDAGFMSDAGPVGGSSGVNTEAAESTGGTSSWWQPDVPGTLPDAATWLDASTAAPTGDTAASRTAPLPPSCSMARAGYTSIGGNAILEFVVFMAACARLKTCRYRRRRPRA